MEDFTGFGLSEQIMANLAEKEYTKPTDVQEAAIPILFDNKDLVIQSQTGSGKTAAFGLPLIHKTMTDVPAVQFLVLVPTRELAAQVRDEVESLAKDTDVKVCAIYGGADMKRQINALRNGAQVVIGTPGRILDHLKRRTMSFSVVRGVVLDEADKMLSMGFLPDVQLIFRHLPKRRQMVMSSATFPYLIEKLIHQYMHEPEELMLSSDDMAPKEIEHAYCILPNEDKEKVLLELIEKEQPELSFIFCNTKTEVKSLAFFLEKAGLKADALSSDLSQSQRERVLKKLKLGQLHHLVCTDLAARGIDVPALSHVFLFSVSNDPETYVHRTGRTGRAGKSGKAISLVSNLDLSGYLAALKQNGLEAIEVQPPTEEEITESRMNNHFRQLEMIDFAKDTDSRDEFEQLAKKLNDDQVKSLLPLLLEHFLRREELEAADQPPPEMPRDDPAPRPERPPRDRGDDGEDGEDGRRGRRRRRRGRGRGRGRGGQEEGHDSHRGRDRDRDRDPRPAKEEGSAAGEERAAEESRERPPREERPSRDSSHGDHGPPSRSSGRPRRGGGRGRKSYITVCVGLGRSDGLDEMDLQSILRRQGKVRMDDIGEIAMKDHESFVDIGESSLDNLLAADGKNYKSYELFIKESSISVDEARKKN